MTHLDNIDPSRSHFKDAQFVFLIAASICIAIIISLAASVASDLRELRSAKRDSVQWTLSQVEIEFLDFLLTLEQATDAEEPAFAELRKDFDVLYSRISIISEGRIFSDVRLEQAFEAATTDILAFLDRTAPKMDSADATLEMQLPEILAESIALRPTVRSIYISGLNYFATQSDQLRARLSSTMLQLSGAAGFLLILLVILTLYSRATNQQLRMRTGALIRANDRMETVLSTSLDGVIVSDTEGRVVDFNEAAERIFGYKFEDIKGQLIGDLIVPEHLREAHTAGMARMAKTGKKKLVGQGHIQIEACRADGSLFPVELALESAQAEGGEIVIAFLRDISERVRNEEELRKARDLALAGEKAKADFLAVMSHEIRTPLNGLLGNLTLLGDTSLSNEQAQYQGNMEISGRQLMKHVNSVLDIARFESGKMPVRYTSFHLGELLQEIVDGQSSQAENNQTAMAWRWVGPEATWVSSDRNHIERILLNLVSNAIKFTKGGRVDIEAERQDEEVEFRVIDTGIGIAEEDQTRIFEDFESTGGGPGGTGLGLGIASRLTHLLQGEIGVESTLDEGSVFWFRIPLSDADAPEETTLEAQRTAPARGLHILLAEDNEMNAFVAQKMLEKEGHSVKIAEDGLQAIEAVKKSSFDVVLMDIHMPKLDGLAATKKIRADIKGAKNMPILAFSANVLPEDKDRFIQSGMDGFIGKPIQLDELRSALEAVTKGHMRPVMKATSAALATNEARDLLGEKYQTFLKRFIAEGDELVAWTETQPSSNEDIQQRCHKLVSTAAMFGAKAFQNALREAERAAKRAEGDAPDLSAVQEAWREARHGLAAELV